MLHTYLQKIGLVTGPIVKNTSHSGLDVLRRYLMGEPQFIGGEEFLKFGSALHKVFLEDIYDEYDKLPSWQQVLVDKMVDELKNDSVVMRIKDGGVCEDKKYKELNGVLLAYILDIKNGRIGADLKTTACTTRADCIAKCITYGYHKQARLYMRMEKLSEFYFIFVCKKSPFNIFVVSYKELKSYEKHADAELEFLLYFYKKYGRFVTEADKLNTQQNEKATNIKAKNEGAKILENKLHKNSKGVPKHKDQTTPTRKKVSKK